MKNFEVQHTIRLYDPELIAAIGRTFEAHSKEFRNKNEFMTTLILTICIAEWAIKF